MVLQKAPGQKGAPLVAHANGRSTAIDRSGPRAVYWQKGRNGPDAVMIILLTIIHVLVCLFLILVVLLQSGKAADIAGAFGGMGSQTTFGPRGAATALSKATTVAAALFMVTSLSLALVQTREASRGVGGASSALDKLKTTSTPAPKAPANPGQVQIPVQIPIDSKGNQSGPIQVVPQGIDVQGGTAPASGQPAPAAPAKK